MPRCSQLAGVLLLIALLAPFYSQQSASWRDPSPHTVQFVTVEKNVRLEVLDWGGSGRPVVPWPGAGTRRTYSTSSHRSSRRTTMFTVLRAAGLARPVSRPRRMGLINRGRRAGGHRRPQTQQTRFGGALHRRRGIELGRNLAPGPDCRAGLPRGRISIAFDNGRGPAMTEFQNIRGPQPPTPGDSDLASFSALQKWDAQVYGFRIPEAEFRQTWDSASSGRVGKAAIFRALRRL